jgi:hypothetical protein
MQFARTIKKISDIIKICDKKRGSKKHITPKQAALFIKNSSVSVLKSVISDFVENTKSRCAKINVNAQSIVDTQLRTILDGRLMFCEFITFHIEFYLM